MERKKRIMLAGEATFLSTGYATYGHELLRRLHDTGKYELMELSSYGPPGDERAVDLPWRYKTVMFDPNVPGERETYHASPTNQFGEWKFEEACLEFRPDVCVDIRDWWMCVGKNTPIHTTSGPKNVQDIQVGDRVLTHTGRYRPVMKVFPERVNKGQFVTLKATNFTLPVTLTAEHPVLAFRRRQKSLLPDFDSIQLSWTEAKDVTPGDIVCLPIPASEGSNLTKEEALVVGYYASEGCCMYEGRKENGRLKGVQFVLGLVEMGCVNELTAAIQKTYGVTATVRKPASSNVLVVRVFSKKVAERLQSLVPGLARQKRVHQDVYNAADEVVATFLAGLFRGDGSLNEDTGRGNYVTTSKDLAIQVYMLCLRLGVVSVLSCGNTKLKGKSYQRYLLNFHGETAPGFVDVWNGRVPSVRSRRIRNGLVYLTIRSAEHFQDEQPVYNFEVEEDNSYVSSFALHNCEFQERSPFRPYYHWSLMPTVDACFVAGTVVITNDGIKNIEDVQVGDLVVSHDGTFNRVSELSERDWHGDFITIDACGPVLPVTMTSDHPVYVVKYRGQKWTHTSRRHRSINHSYNDAKFLPASEVEPGDYLVVSRPSYTSTETAVDISQWLDKDSYYEKDGKLYSRSSSPPLSRSFPLSQDIARFFGLFVAEGSINRSNWEMRLSMCRSKEQNELDFAEKIVKENFGSTTRRLPRDHEDTEELAFYGCLLARFLIRSCGQDTYTRKVPSFLLHAGPELAIPFLEKLFVGDGCDTHTPHGHRVLSFATTSRTLAYQVGRMLLRLGCLCSMSHSKNVYYVTVSNSHGKRLAQLFDWPSQNFDFSSFDNSKSWIDIKSGHALVRVRSIRRRPSTVTKVYNFSVEDKKTYSVGFAVHNCPQNEQWLATFMNADAVFTYSDWGLDQLRTQLNGHIRLKCSAPPGADFDSFHIKKDRQAHRRYLGIDPDALIVGTVMRNQVRKLYPDLIEAFAEFLKVAPPELAKKTFLYLHTAWPDVGWNIPRLIKEAGLGHKTLFTYFCRECGTAFPSFFMDSRGVCRHCNGPNATFPNSNVGVSRSVLCDIMNLFDCYVQLANSEGLGMPQVEAAACGVPVMSVDYSAMSDVVRKLKGTPIRVQRLNREPGTHCYRALPDNQDFVDKLIHFLRLPAPVRQKKGWEARKGVETHYTWERTAKLWEEHFDSVEARPHEQTWDSPPKYHKPNLNVPEGLSPEELIRWGIQNIAGRPDMLNSYTALRMVRDLNWGSTLGRGMGGMYFNDDSTLGVQQRWSDFKINDAVQVLLTMCEQRNHWEKKRVEFKWTDTAS